MIKKINNTQLKFIQSLGVKKYREKERCFLVEGKKGVDELLTSRFEVLLIVCTAPYLTMTDGDGFAKGNTEVVVATEEQMARVGSFKSNSSVMAIVRQQPNTIRDACPGKFTLVLDTIRDPGNLGTIIRTADWFGIHTIIASEQTVELYNPKVIAATMGSFSRVHIGYTSLPGYLSAAFMPVYGTFPGGKPLAETRVDEGGGGLVVIGNESKGISTAVEKYIDRKIGIPRLGKATSLNAAIATGIILYALTGAQQRL